MPPRHESRKQGRGARRPQVAPSNLRGAHSLLTPQGETIVNLLATTTRAPSANKLDSRWRFRACHNTRWRFRAWFLVRTPGSQALSHETPQPRARGLRSDENQREYSHPDLNPTRPVQKGHCAARSTSRPSARSRSALSFSTYPPPSPSTSIEERFAPPRSSVKRKGAHAARKVRTRTCVRKHH